MRCRLERFLENFKYNCDLIVPFRLPTYSWFDRKLVGNGVTSELIIHKPEISYRNGEVELSARIEFNRAIPNVPNHLWFRCPESCEKYLTTRGDGFLLNMLIPAMHFGEDIEVRAEVSPKLLYNLKEYQYLFESKYHLSKVNIQCKNIQIYEPVTDPEAVLLTYSGGVDSTFALWSHLPQNQPVKSRQITHGLLIQGYNAFDIPLENSDYFDFVYEKFRKLFDELGLSLLYVKTNVHEFSKFRIDWYIAQASVLAGIVHLLGGLVKTYLKADTGGYHARGWSYIDSESINLLSSETLETVFFSRIYGREDKLKALAQWEPARTHLRVCLNWQKKAGQLNCSHCRKCRLNMIILKLIGEYDRFPVFEQPFPRFTFLRWGLMEVKVSPLAILTLLDLAKEKKRYGVWLMIKLIGYWKKVVGWAFKKIDSRLSDEARYKIRNRYYKNPQIAD